MPMNTEGPARLAGSNHALWERIQEHGLARWAWWVIVPTNLLTIAVAVLVLGTGAPWIIAAVFVLIPFLIDTAVLNFADMSMRTPEQRPPASTGSPA
ncbi:hypothetical protein [Jatrophihabitans sp.]|uniref:hypothetical protein n=1 Tax=Jatrophihabitans sp. TaxID=1932789 RepID=UPI0030C73F5F|nr:hypothetical protein [Jatrophihabitans sp.]